MAGQHGVGWDAHAYYVAWSGGLYEELPETRDAYNYSPLFAQVIWPLTLLPWPAFCALLVGAAAAGVVWLSRPLPTPLAVGLWLFCLPEILSGNIFWLLAVMTVVGFSRGSPWCVAAFTKVRPVPGPGVVPRASRVAAAGRLRRRERRPAGGLGRHLSRRVGQLDRLPARERGRVLRQRLPDPRDPRLPPGGEAADRPGRDRLRRAHRPPLAAPGRDAARQPGRRVGQLRPPRRHPPPASGSDRRAAPTSSPPPTATPGA